MQKRQLIAALGNSALWMVLIAALPYAQAEATQDPAGFQTLFERYDAVRHALFLDSTEGVALEANAIARHAEELEAGTDVSAEVRELLPDIRERALDLAAAKDLETARAALSELSQPLVRWRKLLSEGTGQDELPTVVYCAMSKKVWLQEPDQRVENPYYGQAMARCGEVVLGGEGE